MSKNTKLILRTAPKFINYSLKINNTIFLSTYTQIFNDDITRLNNMYGLPFKVASFYFNDKYTTITELNQNIYTNLKSYYNKSSSRKDESLTIIDSTLVEKVPKQKNFLETLDHARRMKNEFRNKLANLEYLSTRLFDPDYATGMYNVGKATSINSKITTDNKIFSSRAFDISGYIKVEDAKSDMRLFMVMRGIPVEMRRTQTSYAGDRYNFIFTYPQYIINDIESIASISHIEILDRNTEAKFYIGNTEEEFKVNLEDNHENKNLQIINYLDRNTYTLG